MVTPHHLCSEDSGITRFDAASAVRALRLALSCRSVRRRSRALSSSEAANDCAGPSASGKQLLTVCMLVRTLSTCTCVNCFTTEGGGLIRPFFPAQASNVDN